MTTPFPLLRTWQSRPTSALPRLVTQGEFFYTDQGVPITMIESSEFALYKRYLMGEDITTVLVERHDIGFNLLRVWLMNRSVVGAVYAEGIHPHQHADFFKRLPVFIGLCAAFGHYVEFTAFSSTQDLMPDSQQQRDYWAVLCETLRPYPCLLERVNEYNWGTGQIDTVSLPRPSGILTSSGSATADAPPPFPIWDYVLYHSNDLDQYQRKVGHNAMEWAHIYNVPAMSNENTRFPDRDSNRQHAFDAAAGAALLCAGSCFHSQSGKLSRLFDATERECAKSWVAGARSVPLEVRTGQYIRRDDRLGGGVIRSYERRHPSGSYIVDIHE